MDFEIQEKRPCGLMGFMRHRYASPIATERLPNSDSVACPLRCPDYHPQRVASGRPCTTLMQARSAAPVVRFRFYPYYCTPDKVCRSRQQGEPPCPTFVGGETSIFSYWCL